MNNFITHLLSISELSDEAQKAIENKIEKTEYKKNHILIPELSKCASLFFIEKGIARAYYLDEGKEITDWFGVENMLIGPVVRNFQTKNTPHCVQLLEDSTLTEIKFSDLESLYTNFHEIERLGRLIAIQNILLIQLKLDNLQLLNAKQRYEDFLNRHPTIINRTTLGSIASYLGMNQVTLSRIRKEL